jgi:hypothetical protein
LVVVQPAAVTSAANASPRSHEYFSPNGVENREAGVRRPPKRGAKLSKLSRWAAGGLNPVAIHHIQPSFCLHLSPQGVWRRSALQRSNA